MKTIKIRTSFDSEGSERIKTNIARQSAPLLFTFLFCVLCEATPKTGSLVDCAVGFHGFHDIPAPHVSAIVDDDRCVEWQRETQDETTQNDTERYETTCGDETTRDSMMHDDSVRRFGMFDRPS